MTSYLSNENEAVLLIVGSLVMYHMPHSDEIVPNNHNVQGLAATVRIDRIG